MPVKVNLLDPQIFGSAFYFSPRHIWKKSEAQELFGEKPIQPLLGLLENKLKELNQGNSCSLS